MSAGIAGEVVLVTGASSGIGQALALAVARAGARVALMARRADVLSDMERSLRRDGLEAMACPADVANDIEVEAALVRVRDCWGPISLLAHSAGVFLIRPFLDTSLQEWDEVIRANVRGTFVVVRAVLRDMLAQGRGTILVVSSHWGTKGGPNRAAYIASKHAVIGLTRAVASEFGHRGVRANALCPGPVITPMTLSASPNADMTGWLQVDDLVPISLFLLSPASAVLNGEVVVTMGKGSPATT